MRDHTPIVIEDFNGFFQRGDPEACPPDHFPDCNNVQYQQSAVKTRDGLDTFSAIANPIRMYEFTNTSDIEGLLLLNSNGDIYHVIPNVSATWILHVNGMTDFAVAAFDERAYISPSTNTSTTGLPNEFVYVYKGDGTPARKAAGAGPVGGSFSAALSATGGNVETGIHIFGVVFETDTGFLTAIGDVLAQVTADGTHEVDLSNIPVSPSSFVVARHIVASISIDPTLYTGNKLGYRLFFIPGAIINDNTTTTLSVNFYDSDLLTDATLNFDLFASIPACGGLGFYHGRLLAWNYDQNTCVCLISNPGQPEAFNQVSGLILIPKTNFGITRSQEYRDILYVFRENQTFAFVDNGDVPSSWNSVVIDNGIGCTKHGMIITGEEGSINIEFLILFNLSSIFVFNGTFVRPQGELGWKLRDFWINLSRNMILYLSEFYHDPIRQLIYINFPELNMILMGDYSNGLDFEKIKWAKWTFGIEPTTMSLINEDNKLLIGSSAPAV